MTYSVLVDMGEEIRKVIRSGKYAYLKVNGNHKFTPKPEFPKLSGFTFTPNSYNEDFKVTEGSVLEYLELVNRKKRSPNYSTPAIFR